MLQSLQYLERASDLDSFINKNIHSRAAAEVETRDDRFRNKIAEQFSGKEMNHYVMNYSEFSDARITTFEYLCNFWIVIIGKNMNLVKKLW